MRRDNTIVRDGKVIELTPSEILMVYRYQEYEYRVQDALNAIEYELDFAYDDHGDEKDPMENPYCKALNSLGNDDTKQIAEMFMEQYSCNATENDLWRSVIKQYLREEKGVEE